MAVSIQAVIEILERFAPKKLAEDWDTGIGLQIGDPSQAVKNIFVSLDLNTEVLQEAVLAQADLLIVHHTPFFKPLQHLRTNEPGAKLITEIVRQGMALYTAHTNLDIAAGGVNDALAQKLGLEQTKVLAVSRRQKLYKLAVYLPFDYEEKLRTAITRAGAGFIGNYSECTFQVQGMGTFRPQDGADPFIGSLGVLERVEEIRLETIVPEEKLSAVVKAMLQAHPYEEPAYDIYLLENEGRAAGAGRVGRLPVPLSLREFAGTVKERLGAQHLRYCGEAGRLITKVALCGGSGMSYWRQARFHGADVLVTADVKYHDAQDALAEGLAVIDAGHYATERPVMPVVADFLREQLQKNDVQVTVSQICTDPFCYL
ncbi:MAG: Nif3-like dinuclear metal center hexameric protein [Clostridia bacterium]|jgi:dinuclear metal center YbgI/SA1388 family protein|nr:Nif3-like dinuclear metal center hexameric protein [Clostridia bacterium]